MKLRKLESKERELVCGDAEVTWSIRLPICVVSTWNTNILGFATSATGVLPLVAVSLKKLSGAPFADLTSARDVI